MIDANPGTSSKAIARDLHMSEGTIPNDEMTGNVDPHKCTMLAPSKLKYPEGTWHDSFSYVR